MSALQRRPYVKLITRGRNPAISRPWRWQRGIRQLLDLQNSRSRPLSSQSSSSHRWQNCTGDGVLLGRQESDS